ncbi:MAG TPA: PIN domain-containing protein [Terracidiphilus sp.]|nr:PIN domain-containing protein [Terracidiphilus sp.]
MNSVVLDSAAVLAMILKEPGGERVSALLDAIDLGKPVQVAISAVNWCEILSKLHRENRNMTADELAALLSGVELVPFEQSLAELAASYAPANPAFSLGDRACLALAATFKAKAWTTDKAWARAKVGAQIEILR